MTSFKALDAGDAVRGGLQIRSQPLVPPGFKALDAGDAARGMSTTFETNPAFPVSKPLMRAMPPRPGV